MSASPITQAPNSPSSNPAPTDETVLQVASVDVENESSATDNVFDAELDTLLARLALIEHGHAVELDELAQVVDGSDVELMDKVPSAPAATFSSESGVSFAVEASLTDVRPTDMSTADAGDGSVLSPSNHGNAATIPTPISAAEAQGIRKRVGPNQLGQSELMSDDATVEKQGPHEANTLAAQPKTGAALELSADSTQTRQERQDELQEQTLVPEQRPQQRDETSRLSTSAPGSSWTADAASSSYRDAAVPPVSRWPVNVEKPMDPASAQVATLVDGQPTAALPKTEALSSVSGTPFSDVSSAALSNQVADHVLSARQSIHDGKVQLKVTLNPPELGRITIELTEVDNELSAKLRVSENATLDAIRNSLPAMIDSLHEAGLSLDDLQLENSSQQDFDSENKAEAETSASSAATESDPQGALDDSPDARSRRVDILA